MQQQLHKAFSQRDSPIKRCQDEFPRVWRWEGKLAQRPGLTWKGCKIGNSNAC